MNKILRPFSVMFACVAFGVPTLAAGVVPPPPPPPPPSGAGPAQYAAGHVLVKLRPGVAPGAADALHVQMGVEVLQSFPSIGWLLVRIPETSSVPAAVEAYAARPEVEAAEPDYIVTTNAGPNDPYYNSLYGLQRIAAPAAWGTTIGSPSVVVAVLDTGVFYNHEDLTDNMWRNTGETPGNSLDDDGNGYVDDVYGYDFAYKEGDPNDDNSHGTHCAGTIGATGNNAKGVVGVNWSVRIMGLKFMKNVGGGQAAGNISDAVAAYQYVITMRSRGVNIRVVSNSWGGGPYSAAMKDAVDTAGGAGIISPCAAGNGDAEGNPINTDFSPHYPSCYTSPSVISVAASNASDGMAYFSNYGAVTVDFAAPGVSVLSTVNSVSGYAYYDGTSMATPHVAGAAALLWAAKPDLTVAQVKSALMGSVDLVTAWTGKTVTGGRMNVARALSTVMGAANATLDWAQQPQNAGTRETFPAPPSVRVLDANGNLLTTFSGTVTLGIKPGTGATGAILNGSTIVPAVNGIATFPGLSITKPASGYVLTASTPFAGTLDSAAFNVVSTPVKLGFTDGSADVSAGHPLNPQPVVAAQDQWGNAVPTFTGEVTLAIKPGTGAPGAALSGTLTTPAVAGVAAFNGLSVDTVGSNYVLTAVSGSLTGESGSFNVTPAATKLAFDTQPGVGQATVGLPRQPVVQARDGSGAWAFNYAGPVTLALKDGTGTAGAVLAGTTTVNAASGMAYYGTIAVDRPGTGYVLVASAPGLEPAESAPFDVSPKATRLALTTQPVGGPRGAPLTVQPVVSAQDAAGNTAFGFSGSATLTLKAGTGTPGATLGGTVTLPLVNGTASFTNVSVSRAGDGFVLMANNGGLTVADSQPFSVLPGAVHVSFAGSDAASGATWAAAKRTVQAAVDASPGGDEVWVAAGTYVENVSLKPGVSLYGGFAGNETARTERAPWQNVTTLDGGAAGSVVTVETGATPSTVIEGFTIRNGSSPNGAGVHASGGSPTISGNVIRDNTATSSGGGVYVDGANAVVRGNLLRGNSAGTGGAIFVLSGAQTIVNNTVVENVATVDGGGLALSDSTATVANNIVAGNSSGVFVEPFTSNVPVVLNNDVHGNPVYGWNDADPTGTDGNIATAPEFVNAASGDFRLGGGSPCVDAGNDTWLVAGAVDLAGGARKQGAHVDMGVHERAASIPFTQADVAAALRIAAGLATATTEDGRFGVEGAMPVDLADAARMARKVAGLEPNP